MVFKEVTPYVILFTLFTCTFIFSKTNQYNLRFNLASTDSFFSIVGFGAGFLITLLNLKYSNNYLITLGPLLAITSVLYLYYRSDLGRKISSSFYVDSRTKKIINIIYWLSLFTSMVNFQQNYPYYRSLIFFVCISVVVTLLLFEIYFTKVQYSLEVFCIIIKIIIASLFLRYSAYFISPYPVGSDPWGHANLINYISSFGTIYGYGLQMPLTNYYTNYPIMHIYAAIIGLVGNFGIKASCFVIGSTLVFISLFVYLIAKKIFDDINIALFCIALINFSSYNLQWSIEVIAMSFGIAVYTIIIYFLLASYENKVLPKIFSLMFLFIIVWTHTVSAFITLFSFISLILGYLVYTTLFSELKEENYKTVVSITLCILTFILIFIHWTNPDYPFFDMITTGLIESLSLDIRFLGPLTSTNIGDSWATVLNISGFLIHIFFGIIGCLCCLSKKYLTSLRFSFIFMILVLFFVFFAFPAIGLKDILPSRWPPFIYVSFIPFVGFGSYKFFSIFHNKRHLLILFSALLFICSFFMVTSPISNMDSPIFGESSVSKLIWTDSEVTLCKQIDLFYEGSVITDVQTGSRVFESFLHSTNKIDYFKLDQNTNVDYNYIGNKLVVWREMSLLRPVTFSTGPRWANILLGKNFKTYLDNNFSKIYSTGGAEAYLKI